MVTKIPSSRRSEEIQLSDSRAFRDKDTLIAMKKFNSCIFEKFSILCFILSHKNIAKQKIDGTEKILRNHSCIQSRKKKEDPRTSLFFYFPSNPKDFISISPNSNVVKNDTKLMKLLLVNRRIL